MAPVIWFWLVYALWCAFALGTSTGEGSPATRFFTWLACLGIGTTLLVLDILAH